MIDVRQLVADSALRGRSRRIQARILAKGQSFGMLPDELPLDEELTASTARLPP